MILDSSTYSQILVTYEVIISSVKLPSCMAWPIFSVNLSLTSEVLFTDIAYEVSMAVSLFSAPFFFFFFVLSNA